MVNFLIPTPNNLVQNKKNNLVYLRQFPTVHGIQACWQVLNSGTSTLDLDKTANCES